MTKYLPALAGDTALDMAEQITTAMSPQDNIFEALPQDLQNFIKNRFIIPSSLSQPDMPLMDQSNSLRVSYLKKITGMTKDKTFGGVEQVDGSIIGKSVFPKTFPFIVMLAWSTRQYGYYDGANNEMVVYCESRDNVVPSMTNKWGCLVCKDCNHHSRNRPNWKDDPNKDERCKQRISIMGIGGDWNDLYLMQISGFGIIDFYSNQISKELSYAKRAGAPYYMRTFILTTNRDSRGNHQYGVKSISHTLRTDTTPTGNAVLWEFDDADRDIRNQVTEAMLANIQSLCLKYRDEFQEVGRVALQNQLKLEAELNLSDESEADEEIKTTAEDLGLV